MELIGFPGASEERILRFALLQPQPSASDGENTAVRQIHDALCFAGQRDQVLIALDNEQTIAAVCWTPSSAAGITLLRYLGSSRKGLGTELLRKVAADAAIRQEGLFLEAVPTAAGFYKQLGFRRDGWSDIGYPCFALTPGQTAKLAKSSR
jgi:hypothetical protein